jgi:hypothetical protein
MEYHEDIISDYEQETVDEYENRSLINNKKNINIHFPLYLPSNSSKCNNFYELKEFIFLESLREREKELEEKKKLENIILPKYSKIMNDKKHKNSSKIFTIHTSKDIAYEAAKYAIQNGVKNIKILVS